MADDGHGVGPCVERVASVFKIDAADGDERNRARHTAHAAQFGEPDHGVRIIL